MELTALVEATEKRCKESITQAEQLGIKVHRIAGATILDFAVDRTGTLSGGIRLAEICLADLANVQILPAGESGLGLPSVAVTTDWPLLACAASQYAGWHFSSKQYFSMCSGLARLNRGREELLAHYGLAGHFSPAIGIFESNLLPGEDEICTFAEETKVDPEDVILCIARTASLPGSIQVVARSIETALHKLHELGFDLNAIRNALGTAPLPPIPADDVAALGWTNDSILYGGCVHLWVETSDEAIARVLDRLPSSSSVDFGDPFLKTFRRYDHDFYKIDKLLFSPARVVVYNLSTGRRFDCGQVREDILANSFGLA
jgi:methenyltetrahydromethanopterin cyclohydrolase